MGVLLVVVASVATVFVVAVISAYCICKRMLEDE